MSEYKPVTITLSREPLVRENAELKARVAELEAAAKPRPMSEAPRDGTAILALGRSGWEVTKWAGWGWGCNGCGGDYGMGVSARCWLPLPGVSKEGGA